MRTQPHGPGVFRALVLGLCAVFSSGCASWFEARDSSQAFAEQTLAYLDAGDREHVWGQMSEVVKRAEDKELYLNRLMTLREIQGRVIERTPQINWQVPYVTDLPDGEYRELFFWTEFEHQDFAEEVMLLGREGGEWRMYRYRIK